ncbi:MAG TPA: lysylphosphatidylglycerol synthase transmembrane domain-containing protein [Gaiellaceae bacterium]|nr:lysylphosphatidylglycerol synthase transmembrane domain-containing protein [Gaiellaceae bacterium]
MRRLAHALPRSPWVRIGVVIAALAGAAAAVYWGGPDWSEVGDAFRAVEWQWLTVAVALNLVSVVARAFAWATVIDEAVPPPHPRFVHVFSAFSIGLLANATLPGRVGELTRVAVLTRHMPRLSGAWATLVGTVFAHRAFDVIPAALLVVWVLAAAELPHWAGPSLAILFSIGGTLLLIALVLARHHDRTHLDNVDAARRLVTMARLGLGVMHRPAAAAAAVVFQLIGWLCQLLAVWTAMKAFSIDVELAAAGLVLVLMNMAAIIPLWPGNVGLLQVAIATPLVGYGVPYAQGFAFGLGLQVIEASVGIGFGLVFLGREGLSFAALRRMPPAVEALDDEEQKSSAEEAALELAVERERVSL